MYTYKQTYMEARWSQYFTLLRGASHLTCRRKRRGLKGKSGHHLGFIITRKYRPCRRQNDMSPPVSVTSSGRMATMTREFDFQHEFPISLL